MGGVGHNTHQSLEKSSISQGLGGPQGSSMYAASVENNGQGMNSQTLEQEEDGHEWEL